jgi:beta-glucosidase
MTWRAAVCSSFLAFALQAQDFRNPDLPLDARVADIVSRLTLAEKMSLMSSGQAAVPRLGIAARKVGSEALHGVAYKTATVFPQAQGLGHTWDPDLIRQVGSAVGDEQRVYHNRDNYDLGLQIWSPVVDLARDPRWGRTEEVYGEDPYLTSRIGGAYVRGLQGDDPRYYKTVPTLKHFAANSMENNRGSASSNVDPRNLREYYLAPFENITREQQVMGYMVAYNAINFMPCAATNLIRDLARAEWGFRGMIVTDAGDMQGLMDGHHYVSSLPEAAAAIVKAGMDSITDDQANSAVSAAIAQGLLTESDLDVALRRNFRVRFLMGEFDPPERVPYNAIPDSALLSPEHAALARRVGRESVVLLKNSQGLLPLDPAKVKTVAVIGPRAGEVERDWYAGYLPYSVTPLDGIRQRGGNVLFDDGARKITIRLRSNSRYVTSAGPYSPLAATSSTAGPNETFLAEDFGWGCTTLRSSVTGLYITWNWQVQNQLYAADTAAYGWFYNYCFNFVAAPGGGTGIQHFENWTLGRYVGTSNGSTLTTYRSLQAFDVTEVSSGTDRAAALAAQADVAIVVLGNNTTINGKEAADRPDITLPSAQEALLEAVQHTNPNTVLVVVSSYPYAINWAQQNVPAILYTSHGGQELGNFLGDVLYGDYNPAGRLAMTWYSSASDLPPIEDFDIRNGRTYWYFQGQALYPFGHGLSYTTFDYRNLSVTPAAVGPGDTLTVRVDVQNTGSRAGDEVVQLYVHQRDSKVVRPLQQLKGFQRVSLQPGETRPVTLTLPVSETAFWDVRRSQFTVEKGTLEVRVGSSSADIRVHQDVPISGETLSPRNARQVLRAENYDAYSGVMLTQAGDGAQAATAFHDGDWLAFREVDFGAGVTGMEARVSSISGGNSLEIRLDRVDGPSAGVCNIPATASATASVATWTSATCANIQGSGVHDVFLVFRGGQSTLAWFRFVGADAGAPELNDGGVVDAAAFTEPLLRGSWATAFGSHLATSERGWSPTGTTLPTSLDGTRVQVNGIDAAVSYVKPGQVNFLVPDRVNIGDGVVQVFSPPGASRAVTVQIADAQPEFFNDGRYVAAQHADYSLVTATSPARPGETIVLWGTGFGQTWPPISTSVLPAVGAPLADPGGLQITVGGRTAAVLYAAMTLAGVYQINLVVPDITGGDQEVRARVPGRASVLTVYLPVKQ